MIDVAFIPARSGSKGFPNKNITLVNNEPLIVRAVQCALETNEYHKVIFTSDSDEYIALLTQYVDDRRVIIHKRTTNSSDTDEVDPMIVSVIDELVENRKIESPKTLSLLYPTSPGRTVNTLKESIKLFDGIKPVIGVNVFKDFIWTDSPYTFPLNYDPLNRKSRQLSSKKYFRETKSIYHFNYNYLKSTGSRLYQSPILFEVPQIEGIDIDTEKDLKIYLELNEKN